MDNISHTCLLTKDFREITSDFIESLSQEELQELILKQLEFYLSDENLANDIYLKRYFNTKSGKGVKINEFLKFNSIKKFFPDAITESERIKIIIE